ncbi:MAG: hydrogenase nickel incorporation protein HypB [Desulfatitalea sp.]|nr:hydrogenase nickel incorporation protein HypB [Desulfatitalea sp.]NNK02037.1 hydrogenase nickel incorporation protein HypB [Desulfatitalea sp.]
MKINVVRNILEANARIAAENRELFAEKKVLVMNLMSSPGAGKTSLLEKTIDSLKGRMAIGVIEGDIQSSQDAERIAAKDIPVVQINTGGACHLDGNMIRDTFHHFDFDALDLLVVENVGNLVCPAEFDLGEDVKVAILSVAEGDDKPAKYPLIFHESQALLINKIDLLPYVDCSVEKIRAESLKINTQIAILEVSCRTGLGISEWCAWLTDRIAAKGLGIK